MVHWATLFLTQQHYPGGARWGTRICEEIHAPSACSTSTRCPGFAREEKEKDSNSSF